MKPFMHDHFLLHSETAISLYKACETLPIVDYHCHLDPQAIAENRRFTGITELWLGGDHYKWRLMRANGVPERYITGDAPDDEKFAAWCRTLADCIGNPLYHWAHLELKRYFDCDAVIDGDNHRAIYDHCNAVLNRENVTVRTVLQKFKVEMLATTDDPADSLIFHRSCKDARAADAALTMVLPTFRPSKALQIEAAGFPAYIQALGASAGLTIRDWDGLCEALSRRIDFFAEISCLSADHSLEPPVFADATDADANAALCGALRGDTLTPQAVDRYKTRLLVWLGQQYAAKNWVMQLHMGALRDNNTRMYRLLGADAGFDSMSDDCFARPLSRFLDALETADALPKTVLYALNPTADAMLAAMIGNFQGHGIRGKMQWGCPWWFNDNKPGIKQHLTALACNGILARFIGMLTDSRSFMSYPRHEYFRRILAQTVAEWTDAGEFPNGDMLRRIVQDIAYNNVREYFGLAGERGSL